MSLVPVPSEQPGATCANCNAPLVADQRYCLSCGQPSSPVRLAFLDVLSESGGRAGGQAPPAWSGPGTIDVGPAGYLPVAAQQGASAWLRRNNGLMGLLTVLLLCLLVGLLVGHWVGQGKTPVAAAPQPQIVKVEGLAGLGAVGASGATTTPSTTTPAAATKSKASQEKKDVEEGEHETAKEKAPPKAPVKVAPAKLKKLTQSKGKKHQEEINALGATPIETG
jgi:hypothetical protein